MEKIPVIGALLPFFCLLTIQHAHFSNAQPVNCLVSDREALLEFKNDLEDPGNRLLSWTGSNCCQWRGIQCENSTGSVIAMDLQNPYPLDSVSAIRYGLSGEISPSLIKLKSLRHLDFSFNTFNGISIPAFFGSLLNLQYLNLSNAGFTGIIPPNLGNLSRLQFLDLNSLSLEVKNLQWVTGLLSLKHLAMNGVDLSMIGTDWTEALNQLPYLTELDLSACNLFGYIPSPTFLNFSSLDAIDLSFNNFKSKIPDWLVNITSLQHIRMSFSGLYGRIPLGFSTLPNLLSLDLSGNNNLSASCSQFLNGRWEKIQVLDLASNKLHGKLPLSFGNLTSLVYLDLSDNAVEGGIPSSLYKLCNLKFFSLSGNNLTGSLPEFLEGTKNCPSSQTLPSLQQLHLSNNQLVGKIPEWLGQVGNLVELSLDYNLLEGSIPASLGLLQNLTSLGLAGNKLNESLPKSLGQLSEVSFFDVSSNQLSGILSEAHFSKLGKLKIFQLSFNSFTVNLSSSWIPPFQVRNLGMGSCVLGPSFPSWLKSQNEIMYLDFSNASLSGSIPNWFWDISSNLSLLNISHNDLFGQLPNPLPMAPFADIDIGFNLFVGSIPLTTVGVEFLDLSHNHFSGKIPNNMSAAMPDLTFLSLSYNQLSGEIPMSIGQMSGLLVLDLSNNNLTGRIPSSLGNCSFMNALDLGDNRLFGTIPESLGQLRQLRSLHLNDNHLSGKLPSSFRNLSNLETMDLSNNELSGTIPAWLGDGFGYLRILSLRSNAFFGELLPELSKLSSLQVLDLAGNDLSGSIPASFGDLRAMGKEQILNRYLVYGKYRGAYYEESLIVVIKGQSRTYTKTLSLVTSLDLSGNNLFGNLPHEITKLSGLVVLNLSRNHITGNIPGNISNMHQLSSLDLSSNQLSGAIPPSLSSLSFLGFLNFSNNNLSGAIPYTGQMTTFDESSFVGNPGLCGPPLTMRCLGDDPDHDSDKEGGSEDADNNDLLDKGFYLSLGLGFAAGILVPFLILAMKQSWSDAYFGFLDKVIKRLSWMRHRRGRNHFHMFKPRQRQ